VPFRGASAGARRGSASGRFSAYNRPVDRRDLLKSLAAAAALPVLPALSRVELGAQTVDFTPAQVATLGALAEVVLPTALAADGRDAAVRRFVAWTRGYAAGADRGHGYGNSQLSPPTGPSPALRYPAQFEALEGAAKAQGAATFGALPLAARRTVVQATLDAPPRTTQLPARPNGTSLVADFMGLYFNGAEARDLAYRAAIERDTCRGLDGSEQAPKPLPGR
jgi:hypothetical protein